MTDSYNNEFLPDGPLLESKQITQLAFKVNKLIRQYDAMHRFREMVERWVSEHRGRIAEWHEFKQRRAEHEERIRENPKLQDKDAEPPGDGWRHEYFARWRDENNIEGNFGVSGWVPPELTGENWPDAPLPLPVPDCSVSIQEKFASLAAIHDVGSKGVEKINPWADTPTAPEALAYSALTDVVHALPESDKAHLLVWLAEAKRDLESLALAGARGGSSDENKPTLDERFERLDAHMQRIADGVTAPGPIEAEILKWATPREDKGAKALILALRTPNDFVNVQCSDSTVRKAWKELCQAVPGADGFSRSVTHVSHNHCPVFEYFVIRFTSFLQPSQSGIGTPFGRRRCIRSAVLL